MQRLGGSGQRLGGSGQSLGGSGQRLHFMGKKLIFVGKEKCIMKTLDLVIILFISNQEYYSTFLTIPNFSILFLITLDHSPIIIRNGQDYLK